MKAVGFLSLAAENFHRLIAFDGFAEKLRDVAHGGLNPPADAPEAAAGGIDDQTDDRADDQQYQGQLPVLPEQKADQPDHREALADHDHDRVGAGAGHLLGV